MEFQEVLKVLEVLLFITDKPLSVRRLAEVLGGEVSDEEIKSALEKIAEDRRAAASSVELREIAGGWQFATKPEYAPWVKKLYRDKTRLKLSQSALETLSIIVYRQPVTRHEVEDVRRVESGGVIETLLERKLVKIVGRKETLGRPLLYGTTPEFLKYFGLKHLSELPTIEDFTPPDESISPSDDDGSSSSDEESAAPEDPGAKVQSPESPGADSGGGSPTEED